MPTSVRVSDTAEHKYEIVLGEVRAQLARAHLSQQDVVQRSGLSQSTVSRRLNGSTAFTLPELFDMCGVLGMSVTELLLAADANRPRPGGAGTDPRPVAGARFELATSGLPIALADVVRLHPIEGLTQADFGLAS
jgi:transcriptional regulator with XRE-family HTH domain